MKTKINHFLTTFGRSKKTIVTYGQALDRFVFFVGDDAELNTETYIKFLEHIHDLSPSTQRVYSTAVLKFYKSQKAGNMAELKDATDQYLIKAGRRIVNFNRDELETVLKYCETLTGDILALRDRAFVLTLADTGLRISEACSLKRGDIDWREHRAIIVGKGDKQAVVRFSNRSIDAINVYLSARQDGAMGKALSSLPVFASHLANKIKPIRAGGMWKAIKGRMTEAGIDNHLVRLHDFRHYFVTMSYLAKGNLKLSQELARHESIATTNRYAHFGGEADAAYDEIFNR